MASVQRAHGRHQAECSVAAEFASSGLHLVNGIDDAHGLNQCFLLDLTAPNTITGCVSEARVQATRRPLREEDGSSQHQLGTRRRERHLHNAEWLP